MASLQEPTLDNTVGAAFLGVVAASFLFGVTTLQAYWYYHSYPRDTLLHKYSVAILWGLDTFHLFLTIHAVYTYVVKGFGNTAGLVHILWSIQLQISVNVVMILMVHTLYALRVWRLGGYHHGFLGYIVALVVSGGFGIGIALAYEMYTVDTYPELERISWVINSSLAAVTVIDFVIAAAMCYYLRKSKGAASRLSSRISVVIQYTLGSGLLTSACSLSAMFTYILLPNTFIFLGVEFLLTKLYVVSFLAMLNARQRGRGESDNEESGGERHALKIGITSSFWTPPPSATEVIEDSIADQKTTTGTIPPWQSWDINIPRPTVR
ncbi:hypothetical protein BDQ12DRAFT_719191 [Crucibulum laeve]|uniref:DUF6534 domain-containing protein n=1 Tax=Crucibulum laeve TaxID=68775 RepID=A0A5C3MCC2_9AGAR|nr:hypothetical protein BDQ12DRAFT_719191 [Crucibulum laeve]